MKNLIARRNQPFLVSFFCSKTTADLSLHRYDTWKVNEKCLEIAIDIGAHIVHWFENVSYFSLTLQCIIRQTYSCRTYPIFN